MSNENILGEAIGNLSREQLLHCADGDENALLSALRNRATDRFFPTKKEKAAALHALMKGPDIVIRRKIVALYETQRADGAINQGVPNG